MKRRLLTLILLFLAPLFARAQFSSFGSAPIEINSENTQFVGGVAVAENNVVIRYGETTIYCDYAEYNPETRDVLLKGNVRGYRDGHVFLGERALYNLETKVLRAADFRGDFYPLLLGADTLNSLSANAFQARDAFFTTSDSSKPDYHIRAKSVRIYAKDRVIFSNAFLYIGSTPVFWWPYLYQSLDKRHGFTFHPGYENKWGMFLRTQFAFPIGENMTGSFHLDLYANRGVGLGLDTDFKYGKDDRSWGKFRSYYIHDSQPGTNKTSLDREPIDADRYRVSLQHRLFITDDIYANININKWSDPRITEDFFPTEFRLDPQPDNVISVAKTSENYTGTLVTRFQLNNFFQMTERLPEFAFEMKRQPFFSTPLFYQGDSSAGYLQRYFAKGSSLPNYQAARVDTYHQLLYPQVYGGWLSFIPHAGLRGTYYSDSGRIETENVVTTLDTLLPNGTQVTRFFTKTQNNLTNQGAVFRGVVDAGFDASFKFSREYEGVQSRAWGLDGLRHIVQPYTDLSFAYATTGPDDILQFDRLIPSTELPSFDFPQFTGIDAISDWTVWKFGVRQRWQTKRDNQTLNWLEFDTFFNVNLQQPTFPGADLKQGTLSNLYTNVRWQPLPWVGMAMASQIPLYDKSFTQINTSLNFLVNENVRIDIGQRYLNNSPFFRNSSLVNLGGYLRINDNWGFSVREEYEFADNTLESQRYELHRDLSSWIASLGVVVLDNNKGNYEYGVLLSFTLKDMPQVNVPAGFDPQSLGGQTK